MVGVAVPAPLSIVPSEVVHAYDSVPCPLDADPSKVSVKTLQLSSAVAPASAIGACTSSVITTLSLDAQPVTVLVTVKV